MTTTRVWQVVVDAAERAGVGHVKPHDLWRTLATELLETRAPVHYVKEQLGHAYSQTTLQNSWGMDHSLGAGQRLQDLRPSNHWLDFPDYPESKRLASGGLGVGLPFPN